MSNVEQVSSIKEELKGTWNAKKGMFMTKGYMQYRFCDTCGEKRLNHPINDATEKRGIFNIKSDKCVICSIIKGKKVDILNSEVQKVYNRVMADIKDKTFLRKSKCYRYCARCGRLKHIGGDHYDPVKKKMKKCPYNMENKEEHHKELYELVFGGKESEKAKPMSLEKPKSKTPTPTPPKAKTPTPPTPLPSKVKTPTPTPPKVKTPTPTPPLPSKVKTPTPTPPKVKTPTPTPTPPIKDKTPTPTSTPVTPIPSKKTTQKSPKKDECDKDIEAYKSDPNKSLYLKNKKYKNYLKCVEKKNIKNLKKKETNILYPHINDPNLVSKITNKEEFNETVKITTKKEQKEKIENVEIESNKNCEYREFELNPHQKFVRNFLSNLTPYNGLLLFHGLGTGKTCSSIQVCEEVRKNHIQMGLNKKIFVVASPAVQENYKRQLFDDNKLEKINGLWQMKSCTGDIFINEVNPMKVKNISKNIIVNQINTIISKSYRFFGYTAFSNYIRSIIEGKKNSKRAINKIFSDTIIVIDEVQNIKNDSELKKKKTGEYLEKLVILSENTKLLLLSATPLFNDYSEIIWITNLLNFNDNRFGITRKEIFRKKAKFGSKTDKKDKLFKKGGKELLMQKLNGYVSYIKGENLFLFPYRIFPKDYKHKNSLLVKYSKGWKYPKTGPLNDKIETKVENLDIMMVKASEYQEEVYFEVISNILKRIKKSEQNIERVNYTLASNPLQALNIVYPNKGGAVKYGRQGLNGVMVNDNLKNFRYRNDIPPIFDDEHLGKYSPKMKQIISTIKKTKGIVLIYSQYISGGCVPLALALESMGIKKYKNRSLFKKNDAEPVDYLNKTVNDYENETDFKPTSYIMITGEKTLSPDNDGEMKAITNKNNINGEEIKVVIISKAGSEGLDFKNVRQVHILDPWYNLNRIDQIIGRAIRNLSHCGLPYKQRNAEIFLYATEFIKGENKYKEAVDLYLYRFSEAKSQSIGTVSRLLKEIAVDCQLTDYQHEANNSYIKKLTKKNTVKQELSSDDIIINYPLGNKDNSIICDFMECDFKCSTRKREYDKKDTYNYEYMTKNNDIIIKKIKTIFKESYVLEKSRIVQLLNTGTKVYSINQIDSALNTLINDKTNMLQDMFNNNGRLINVGDKFMFQPLKIDDTRLTNYERRNNKPYNQSTHGIKIEMDDVQLDEIDGETLYENVMGIYKTILYGGSKYGKSVILYKSVYDMFDKNADFQNNIIKYIIHHYLDKLSFEQKTKLFEYVKIKMGEGEAAIGKMEDGGELLSIIYEYFSKNIVEYKNNEYLGLATYDGVVNYKFYDITKSEMLISTRIMIEVERLLKEKIEKFPNDSFVFGYMDKTQGEKHFGNIMFYVDNKIATNLEKKIILKFMNYLVKINKETLIKFKIPINIENKMFEIYLRYLDDINYENKRYFYNTFEWQMIKMLKIKIKK